jgi:MFS family permease
VLATAGLMLGVYAIVNGSWVAGAVAVVLLAAFVARESSFRAPLSSLRTFRSVAGVNAVLGLLIATGLAMIPIAVAIGTVSLLFSARLNVRFGERPVLLAGLVLIVVGLTWFATGPTSFVAHILPAVVLQGFGAAMPALMALGMATATEADAGLMSGLFNTSQQVGGALGLSVLVAVTTSYQQAFALAAVLVAAAAVTAVLVLRRSPARSESDGVAIA